MRPELFARLLAPPSAPFLAGVELLAEAPSELLAKVAGGVLFFPDLTRLGRAEQRSLEFLLGRTEKHKARLVCFSPVNTRTLAEKHEFDPELARQCDLGNPLALAGDTPAAQALEQIAERLLDELESGRESHR